MPKRAATLIGQNIRKYRHRLGISQDALSKRADLTVITIINVESGKTANPTIATVKKIARALQVSLDDLVG
ncbi:helix-turn-helix domain-containing protein [Patescibacteria group bacterium]|nr:helix-turn-helix domain-containing protein [Patescibacteria group bacterium]